MTSGKLPRLRILDLSQNELLVEEDIRNLIQSDRCDIILSDDILKRMTNIRQKTNVMSSAEYARLVEPTVVRTLGYVSDSESSSDGSDRESSESSGSSTSISTR